MERGVQVDADEGAWAAREGVRRAPSEPISLTHQPARNDQAEEVREERACERQGPCSHLLMRAFP